MPKIFEICVFFYLVLYFSRCTTERWKVLKLYHGESVFSLKRINDIT